MNAKKIIATTIMALCGISTMTASPVIGRAEADVVKSQKMTPEVLWSMGRIASAVASPDGKNIVYQVGYYSVKQNKSHHVLYIVSSEGGTPTLLTVSEKNETDPQWIENGEKIAFLSGGQLWTMDKEGKNRKKISDDKMGINAFKFSPNGKHVILTKSLPFNNIRRTQKTYLSPLGVS